MGREIKSKAHYDKLLELQQQGVDVSSFDWAADYSELPERLERPPRNKKDYSWIRDTEGRKWGR